MGHWIGKRQGWVVEEGTGIRGVPERLESFPGACPPSTHPDIASCQLILLYTHRRDTIGITTTSGSFFPLSKASVLSYQRALRKDWSIWKLGELYDHKVGFWWQLHSHISQCTGFLYLDPKWLSSHDQNTQIKWQYSKCMMWFTLRYRTNNGVAE